jgi:hypothetical protein
MKRLLSTHSSSTSPFSLTKKWVFLLRERPWKLCLPFSSSSELLSCSSACSPFSALRREFHAQSSTFKVSSSSLIRQQHGDLSSSPFPSHSPTLHQFAVRYPAEVENIDGIPALEHFKLLSKALISSSEADGSSSPSSFSNLYSEFLDFKQRRELHGVSSSLDVEIFHQLLQTLDHVPLSFLSSSSSSSPFSSFSTTSSSAASSFPSSPRKADFLRLIFEDLRQTRTKPSSTTFQLALEVLEFDGVKDDYLWLDDLLLRHYLDFPTLSSKPSRDLIHSLLLHQRFSTALELLNRFSLSLTPHDFTLLLKSYLNSEGEGRSPLQSNFLLKGAIRYALIEGNKEPPLELIRIILNLLTDLVIRQPHFLALRSQPQPSPSPSPSSSSSSTSSSPSTSHHSSSSSSSSSSSLSSTTFSLASSSSVLTILEDPLLTNKDLPAIEFLFHSMQLVFSPHDFSEKNKTEQTLNQLLNLLIRRDYKALLLLFLSKLQGTEEELFRLPLNLMFSEIHSRQGLEGVKSTLSELSSSSSSSSSSNSILKAILSLRAAEALLDPSSSSSSSPAFIVKEVRPLIDVALQSLPQVPSSFSEDFQEQVKTLTSPTTSKKTTYSSSLSFTRTGEELLSSLESNVLKHPQPLDTWPFREAIDELAKRGDLESLLNLIQRWGVSTLHRTRVPDFSVDTFAINNIRSSKGLSAALEFAKQVLSSGVNLEASGLILLLHECSNLPSSSLSPSSSSSSLSYSSTFGFGSPSASIDSSIQVKKNELVEVMLKELPSVSQLFLFRFLINVRDIAYSIVDYHSEGRGGGDQKMRSAILEIIYQEMERQNIEIRQEVEEVEEVLSEDEE